MNCLLKYFLFTLLIFLLQACIPVKQDDQLLPFDEKNLIHGHTAFNGYNMKWTAFEGTAVVDTLTKYKTQNTLILTPCMQDSIKKARINYQVWINELDGNTIHFSGKYQYTGADTTSTYFKIIQTTKQGNDVVDSLWIKGSDSNKTGWTYFCLKATMSDVAGSIMLSAGFKGNVKLRLADCRLSIDGKSLNHIINREYRAETDNEFDKGSGIVLESPSSQTTENLEVLGKVWGFLKYYHPEVVQGNYNWDYELFRVLPGIAQAKNKQERNKLLNKWIDKYGKIKETKEYEVTDSSKYTRFIKLDWLADKNLFDEDLIDKLDKIRKAKRSKKFNYYVLPYYLTNQAYFTREKNYITIKWEDQGFRILTLFKLWNAITYCFPYVEMTDTPWCSLLKKYIPRIVTPANQAQYELALKELAASIDDSHGYINIPYSDLSDPVLAKISFQNGKKIPVSLDVSKEGKIVVKETSSSKLKRGDVICSIDSIEVEKIIENLSPYFPSSNKPTLLRNILPYLLVTGNKSVTVTCIRNGKEIQETLEYTDSDKRNVGIRSWETYNLLSKQIAYISAGQMNSEQIMAYMQKNMNTKGLIIDLREYPRDHFFFNLSPLLTPTSQRFIWFSCNDKSYPGNYKYDSEATIKSNNPDYYKGKVAILVNEHTQSHGEYSAIGYRKAPRSTIIGSTTAGADGNLTVLQLPHNIKFSYTALGTYYPNWEICQRKGVKIDIEVRPTIEQIRNGQDVLIEEAIKYIEQE